MELNTFNKITYLALIIHSSLISGYLYDNVLFKSFRLSEVTPSDVWSRIRLLVKYKLFNATFKCLYNIYIIIIERSSKEGSYLTKI